MIRTIYVLLGLSLLLACGDDATEPAPADEPAADEAVPAAGDAHEGLASEGEPASDAPSTANVVDYLPSVDEFYTTARNVGLGDGVQGLIRTSDPDLDQMGEAARALAVGGILSDVAYLLVQADATKPPPEGVVERAQAALVTLDPPAAVQMGLTGLIQGIESGELQDQELRRQVDTYLRNVLPLMVGNDGFADSGNAAMFGGFLRSTYVGATALAQADSPTEDQLSLLRQPQLASYFRTYFEQSATDTWKQDETIVKAVAAATELETILSSKTLTQDDARKIAELLAPLAG
jgi:hypothetical protein